MHEALIARSESGRCYSLPLPERPVITGGVGSSWVSFNLSEIWGYRELLYFLTWRDIKVRYKQTVMGAAWAVIQPLVTMLVFTIFFSKFVGNLSGNVPYPVFAYAGLVPWVFFANAVTNCSNSLISSSSLITKVYFPRMILPAAAVGAGLIDLAIAAAILIALTIGFGVRMTWSVALLPLFVVLMVVLALGVGILISALAIRYRDTRHALPFVLQIWMFASPIIYPLGLVNQKWRWLVVMNPMTGVIEGFRASLTGQNVVWHVLIPSISLTAVILVFAAFTFRRLEKSFADLI